MTSGDRNGRTFGATCSARVPVQKYREPFNQREGARMPWELIRSQGGRSKTSLATIGGPFRRYHSWPSRQDARGGRRARCVRYPEVAASPPEDVQQQEAQLRHSRLAPSPASARPSCENEEAEAKASRTTLRRSIHPMRTRGKKLESNPVWRAQSASLTGQDVRHPRPSRTVPQDTRRAAAARDVLS